MRSNDKSEYITESPPGISQNLPLRVKNLIVTCNKVSSSALPVISQGTYPFVLINSKYSIANQSRGQAGVKISRKSAHVQHKERMAQMGNVGFSGTEPFETSENPLLTMAMSR